MHADHLGDSYDLVKRFFAIALHPIAEIFAHPRFIPPDIRDAYTKLTSIPVLDANNEGDYALFLDPDTGIHLPDGANQKQSRSHVSLAYLCEVFEEFTPSFLVCYDQGFHRRDDRTLFEQVMQKREYLQEMGIESFYYVSHAPFLFASDSISILHRVAEMVVENGIPQSKLEPDPRTGV